MFRANQMGVYFHWPFCASKCPYCDFNSHVRDKIDEDRMLDAYLSAIDYYAALLPEKEVVSIFFGGGTPSLMTAQTVEAILARLQKNWRIVNDLEVTLEANPTSVEAQKFSDFKAAGVTRVSLGVQSLSDDDLKFLGRAHDAQEAIKAIEIAGHYFDRYSFDLIYARPNQSLKTWEQELRTALKYARGHLSLYQLTIERNTPFYMRYNRGEFSIPDDVAGADFYHLTQDILEDAKMPAYEVSNHAAAGQECRHNQVYWHYADYIGIGAGAHGRYSVDAQKRASRDHAAPEIWLERVEKNGHGAHPYDLVEPQDKFAESLMMGLRLRSGVSLSQIEALSGFTLDQGLDYKRLDVIIREGWAVRNGDVFSLTREGLLRLNAIIPYILKV